MSTDDTRAGEDALVDALARAHAEHTEGEGSEPDALDSECASAMADHPRVRSWLTAHDARVRAADAAEIDRLDASYFKIARKYDEASAERDRLAAEVERLQTYIDSQPYQSDVDDANKRADRLAAGVRQLAERWGNDADTTLRAMAAKVARDHSHELRALLAPTDDQKKES